MEFFSPFFSASCYLVLVKDIEDKGGKLGGVAEGEELLVDLLKASCVQLTTGAIFNKTLIPAHGQEKMKQDKKSEDCKKYIYFFFLRN